MFLLLDNVNAFEVVLPCLHLMCLLQELHCVQRKQLEVASAVNSFSGKMVTLFIVSVQLLRRPMWPTTFMLACFSCSANVLWASANLSWRDGSASFATQDLSSASVFQLRDGLSVIVPLDACCFRLLDLLWLIMWIIMNFDANFDSSD